MLALPAENYFRFRMCSKRTLGLKSLIAVGFAAYHVDGQIQRCGSKETSGDPEGQRYTQRVYSVSDRLQSSVAIYSHPGKQTLTETDSTYHRSNNAIYLRRTLSRRLSRNCARTA
jgi:hypothetical protein